MDRPELVSIIGPNGVGKTTMLKSINRILKPTAGIVEVNGSDVHSMSMMKLARMMTFLPNRIESMFRSTVAEIVLMGRFPFSQWATSDEDLDIADSAVDALGLQPLSERKICELSFGQMQKVLIARRLAQCPKVLILDEPMLNIDMRHQMEVMSFLRRYSAQRCVLILMVCHDLELATSFAEKIIIVSEGTVLADGAPWDMMTEDNIHRVYAVESTILDVEGKPHIVLLRKEKM